MKCRRSKEAAEKDAERATKKGATASVHRVQKWAGCVCQWFWQARIEKERK